MSCVPSSCFFGQKAPPCQIGSVEHYPYQAHNRRNGTTMELSIMVEPQLGSTYDDLLAIALWAEDSGFSSFARSDHYLSSRQPRPDATDAFATLAGLARYTSTIALTVLVAPFTFRHPAVVLKNATTIDQMSGGRFELGVGTGWMGLEHDQFGIPFPAQAERFARLEEGLRYLRAAFTGEQFSGTHYHLATEVAPKPTGTLPIIVGGSGPVKTPILAGTYADEYNLFINSRDELQPRIDLARATAAEYGRSLKVSVMSPVLVGTTEADFRARLQSAADIRGIPVHELEEKWRSNSVRSDLQLPRKSALKSSSRMAPKLCFLWLACFDAT